METTNKTWQDEDIWFGGAMVHPNTNDATNYCVENGKYFEKPNAWFVEGFEEGDCDAKILAFGTVPGLGDRTPKEMDEIWENCFSKLA